MSNKVWNHLVAVAFGATVTTILLFLIFKSLFLNIFSDQVLIVYVPSKIEMGTIVTLVVGASGWIMLFISLAKAKQDQSNHKDQLAISLCPRTYAKRDLLKNDLATISELQELLPLATSEAFSQDVTVYSDISSALSPNPFGSYKDEVKNYFHNDFWSVRETLFWSSSNLTEAADFTDISDTKNALTEFRKQMNTYQIEATHVLSEVEEKYNKIMEIEKSS